MDVLNASVLLSRFPLIVRSTVSPSFHLHPSEDGKGADEPSSIL
jgi:hypothetical protein